MSISLWRRFVRSIILRLGGQCILCIYGLGMGKRSKRVLIGLASVVVLIVGALAMMSFVSRKPSNLGVVDGRLAECPASKEIQQLAAEYGVQKTRFKVKNPEEQCLLCGLCVRVCQEVVGVRAISFGSRGVHKYVATPYMIPNQACIGCGSCVTVCPTGAMQARLDRVRGDISERTGHGFAH